MQHIEILRTHILGAIVKVCTTTAIPGFLVFFLGVALCFGIGCSEEAIAPTGTNDQDHVRLTLEPPGSSAARLPDTTQCNTVSGILLSNKSLKLNQGESRVRYGMGSVAEPILVSFSLCDLYAPGTPLVPKAAVFGPTSTLMFLKAVEAELTLSDAGLPADTRDKSYFKLYRQNEVTGEWDSVMISRITRHKVKYQISRNGTYAITLDTTWSASGVIPPGGGVISLLSSNISFPPGALRDSTLVSFTMTTGRTPVGLPGATDRVFDFGPEGKVFEVPVSLSISFDEAGFDGVESERKEFAPLALYYFDPSTGSWVQQPTETQWENRRFVIALTHFSRYAFGR